MSGRGLTRRGRQVQEGTLLKEDVASQPPPCDQKVYDEGATVCTFHAGSKITEAWVRKVRKESGQQVDWHYIAGYANVLFLGDASRVRAAVEKLKPELDAACAAEGKRAEHFRMYDV